MKTLERQRKKREREMKKLERQRKKSRKDLEKKRKQSTTPEQKRDEKRERDRCRKAKSRSSPIVRDREKKADRESHAARRLDLDYRAQERRADREHRATRRTDPDYRASERQADREHRAARRTDPENREREQRADRERRAARHLQQPRITELGDVSGGIPLLDPTHHADIVAAAQAMLTRDHWLTCVFCDEISPSLHLNLRHVHQIFGLEDMPTQAWALLKPPDDRPLHHDLLVQYQVGGQFAQSHPLLSQQAKALLLSPRGVITALEYDRIRRFELPNLLSGPSGGSRNCAHAQLLVSCSKCWFSLRNKKFQKPPKFAIANGFYIGQLPRPLRQMSHHSDTGSSLTELDLVRPVHLRDGTSWL